MLAGQDEILEYRIFGETGHIVFDVTEGYAAIHGRDGAIERLDPLPADERYPDWAPVDNLVDLVLERAPNGSPADIGVTTVAFVEAMYRAARERRTVDL